MRQALLLVSLPVSLVLGHGALNCDIGFAADHFARLDRCPCPDTIEDQRNGGAAFAWAGDVLSILNGLALLIVRMRATAPTAGGWTSSTISR